MRLREGRRRASTEKCGGGGGEQETNKCKLKINGVGQVVNIRVGWRESTGDVGGGVRVKRLYLSFFKSLTQHVCLKKLAVYELHMDVI